MTEIAIPEWADGKLSKELPVLRARGENQDLEFMESFPKNTSDLAKEIAAFATTNQGTILIGVKDEGELKGLKDSETSEKRDNYIRRIEGICRGTINPSITPTVRWAVEDGRAIIVIFVPKGSQPVYYSNGKPYIRHITESRPAEPHEIIDLVKKWLPLSNFGEEPEDPFSKVISELSTILVDVLIFAEEVEKRYENPWVDMWRSQFAQAASELRDIAVNDLALEKGLSDELNHLANLLDSVANFLMTMGSLPQMKEEIGKILTKSKQIKAKWIDSVGLSESSISHIKKTIIELDRKLSNLCERAGNEQYIFRKTEDFQSEASKIGFILLKASYYNLDSIKEGLSSELMTIARDLHLVETERLYTDGGHSIRKLVERIKNDSEKLNKLVAEISL